MCSRVLQRIQVKDMGMQLAGLERSHVWQTGATLASFQIGGRFPSRATFGRDVLGLVIVGSKDFFG